MTQHDNIALCPAHRTALLSMAVLLLLSGGCGGPYQANIELRKQKQELEEKVATLERTVEADKARIRGLESRAGTLPTLPQERLANLFTVHSIELGRLTGGADLDTSKPGEEGLKVYVTPLDEDGQKLKAAGSFVIEAFDLALPKETRIGRWEFDTKAARGQWVGMAIIYAYILPCRWQVPPQHEEITIKATFRDELTGRVLEQQMVVKVKIPGSK